MLGIGKSAGLLPKSVKNELARPALLVWIGYGRLSETERVSVSNEGRPILSWLKIQSDPL
jgi:hypothetical protein